MFTLQLHIPLKSPLGQRIPLVQHLIATAVVMGIKNIPGYEVSPKQQNAILFILTNILFLDHHLIHHIIFFKLCFIFISSGFFISTFHKFSFNSVFFYPFHNNYLVYFFHIREEFDLILITESNRYSHFYFIFIGMLT